MKTLSFVWGAAAPQISLKPHFYRWLLHLCGLMASQGFVTQVFLFVFPRIILFWWAPGGVYLRSLFCAPGHHQRVTVKLHVDVQGKVHVHVNILKPICIGKGYEKWLLKSIKLGPLYSLTYRYHPWI